MRTAASTFAACNAMKKTTFVLDEYNIPSYQIDTIVIGSGCAGFNAVDWLYDLGRKDIALVTEGLLMGTSRNTGSDKQTYYKLSLASDDADSVREMAKTLFEGGGVHGDNALTEAACSVRSFMKLANLGVPFPYNPYGEYVGYKTDHDPRQRATSAGPLTSKYMTEALEKSVRTKGIAILDHLQATSLLVENNRVYGAICIDKTNLQNAYGLTLLCTNNVILATGGPAGIYYTSVYPESQTGATGLAIEAGAKLCNLHEWQYGLASTKFRWNVSGTYQQILPKYIAVDKDGRSREFLLEYFETPQDALNMVFLKGYQWPFDARKVNGSSMIDMIIHHEIFDLGNRVYMDFRENPTGLAGGFDALSDEAYQYLAKSGALLESPIKRLAKMNPKAIELYASHEIDLYSEPLEVCVCAQHNNGGIAVDSNWQTSIAHLYAAGEAAGTFGTYRPGGSALNATQVGSMRAAQHIACTQDESCPVIPSIAKAALRREVAFAKRVLQASGDVFAQREAFQKRMSSVAAHIRRPDSIQDLSAQLPGMQDALGASFGNLPDAFKNRDLLLCAQAVLDAIYTASTQVGSRGSGLVLQEDGAVISPALRAFSYKPSKPGYEDKVLITAYENDEFASEFSPVRPIPEKDDWFENVWNAFNERTARVHS